MQKKEGGREVGKEGDKKGKSESRVGVGKMKNTKKMKKEVEEGNTPPSYFLRLRPE